MVQRADDLVAPRRQPHDLQGAVGEDLVHVHVDKGPRAALEGVHDDVLVKQTLHHLVARLLQSLGRGGQLEVPQLRTRPYARQLHGPVGVDEGGIDAAAGEREVLERPVRVNAVQGLGRDLARAQQVMLKSVLVGQDAPRWLRGTNKESPTPAGNYGQTCSLVIVPSRAQDERCG